MFRRITNSTWLDFAFLTVLVAAVTWANDVWITTDSRPPHWDMGRHLWNSLLYLDHSKDFQHFYRLWTSYYYYPPLRYWLTLPFYYLGGTSLRVAVFSNVLFVFILAFSVYGIGRELWNRRTALLAVLFIIASPLYVTQFKEYQLDAQQGAMTALAFYLFLKTRDFRERRWSLLFGISFGLGMLTKWTFCFCAGLPVLVGVLRAWKSNEPERKDRLKNVFHAFLIAVGISLIWYANHPRLLRNDLLPWVNGAIGDHSLSVGALFYYPRILEQYQLYLIPLLMFVYGLFFSWASKEAGTKNKYLLLFILGNYSMTFIKLDVRYTMPVIVGIALVSVFWITEIKNVIWSWTATLLVTVYCGLAFWFISFGSALLPWDVSIGGLEVFAQKGYLIGQPVREKWYQEDIYKLIAEYPPAQRELAYDGPGTYSFNSWGFYYYSQLYHIPYKTLEEKPYFILMRTEKNPKAPAGYHFIKKYDLPDQTVVFVFLKGKNS